MQRALGFVGNCRLALFGIEVEHGPLLERTDADHQHVARSAPRAPGVSATGAASTHGGRSSSGGMGRRSSAGCRRRSCGGWQVGQHAEIATGDPLGADRVERTLAVSAEGFELPLELLDTLRRNAEGKSLRNFGASGLDGASDQVGLTTDLLMRGRIKCRGRATPLAHWCVAKDVDVRASFEHWAWGRSKGIEVAAEPRASSRRSAVWVVDDDEVFLSATQRYLEREGYDVTAFSSSISALEQFEKGADVDLLISDIMLGANQPHGVSLGNMMKHKRPSVRSIYVTACLDTVVRVRRLDTVFEKPVQLDRLAAAVKAALQSELSQS
jgi:CheY-like chemotaxis protein